MPYADPHHERAVLITGSSSGIGLCAAKGLQARGYRVFATARQRADVERLQAEGLTSLVLDLADSINIRGAVSEILDQTGGQLYGLINNGAYGQPGAVEDLSREALRAQFETNLFGTHELTTQLTPVFRRAGEGRIIQISSILGLVCLAYRGAYNASKYALEALSDTLRMELAGTGIHVTLIEPGAIHSRFRANAYRYFRQYIDPEPSPHRHLYRTVGARLLSKQEAPFSLPPEAVLKKIVHALESRRPRLRYRVTGPAHLLANLKRLLPDRWMDGLLDRAGR